MNVQLPLPPTARRLGARVEAAGGRAFVVGGGVRDHLLGLDVKDWDIEVFGLELKPLERLLRKLGQVNAVGRSFGVFKLTDHGVELDVSIPRRDSKVGPGHRGIAVAGDPTMTPAEAAARRDLTVNALMANITTGELIDPTGGRSDLDRKLLRPVDEDTFLEDPLRALRAVQFAARFNFEPTPTLIALCAQARVDELPAERVVGEWLKLLLRGRFASCGLALARSSGLLHRTFPTLVDHPAVDAALDRGFALFSSLDTDGRRAAAGLLTWLSATPTEAAEAVLDRLGLHRWGQYPIRDQLLRAHLCIDEAPASDAELRHLSTRCHLGLLLAVQEALRPTGPAADHARRAAALNILWEPPKPLILGRDLIRMGMTPGPAIGTILDAIYQRQLDGELTTTDDARQAAKALLDGR